MTSVEEFAFLHRLRVRWNECDAQGIVFNVNYLLYCDIAVWEWTRAIGYATWQDAPEFVTARIESDFRAAAVFDDELEIGVRAGRFGTKSWRADFGVFRSGALLNETRVTYVHVRKGTKDSEPLPAHFMDRVRTFERRASDGGSKERRG